MVRPTPGFSIKSYAGITYWYFKKGVNKGVGLVVSQKGVVGPHLKTTTRLTQKWLPENRFWA